MENPEINYHAVPLFGQSLDMFFAHLSDRVVFAISDREPRKLKLINLLTRIRSVPVQHLIQYFSVNILGHGLMHLEIEGTVKYLPLASPKDTPFIEAFTREKWLVLVMGAREDHRCLPISYLYVILNVGSEGWCVFTVNFHTLIHVLWEHNMEAEHLYVENACGVECHLRSDKLEIHSPAPLQTTENLKDHCSTVIKARLIFADSLCFQFMHEMVEIPPSRFYYYFVINTFDGDFSYLLRYLAIYDYFDFQWSSGRFLIAGFDAITKTHKAAGNANRFQPVVEVYRKQGEAVQFLRDMRPLLKVLEERAMDYNINQFVRNFTQVHAMKWKDAMTELYGLLTLKMAAFQQVRQLPLWYLGQHAPSPLYNTVVRTRCAHPEQYYHLGGFWE